MSKVQTPQVSSPADPSGATAALWAQRWFGGPTRLRTFTITAGTSVATALKNNPKRLFWQIINRSTNNVSIGFDNTVTVAAGIPIAQLAGYASMAVQEDGEATMYEVDVIADTANSTLNVIELERV